MNERVKSKIQDLTNLLGACFLSDENMQNATHLEYSQDRSNFLPLPTTVDFQPNHKCFFW